MTEKYSSFRSIELDEDSDNMTENELEDNIHARMDDGYHSLPNFHYQNREEILLAILNQAVKKISLNVHMRVCFEQFELDKMEFMAFISTVYDESYDYEGLYDIEYGINWNSVIFKNCNILYVEDPVPRDSIFDNGRKSTFVANHGCVTLLNLCEHIFNIKKYKIFNY